MNKKARLSKPLSRLMKVTLVAFVAVAIILQLWQFYWPTATLRIGDETLHVQVAHTVKHQQQGLGKRDDLGNHDGMLFTFGLKRRHAFVMRDMRFPIDIVWLNDGKVVDIAPSVPPEPNVPEAALKRYYPRAESNAVLELPAGWAAEHDLRIGDLVHLLAD